MNCVKVFPSMVLAMANPFPFQRYVQDDNHDNDKVVFVFTVDDDDDDDNNDDADVVLAVCRRTIARSSGAVAVNAMASPRLP
jgi:hypothetical protein